MGNRPTHRPHARNSCGVCKPGKREGVARTPGRDAEAAADLSEHEQRAWWECRDPDFALTPAEVGGIAALLALPPAPNDKLCDLFHRHA